MRLQAWEHHEVGDSRVEFENGWGYALIYQWMPSEEQHDPQWQVHDADGWYVDSCETEQEARVRAEGMRR